jgi:hypothetical protein
LLYIAKLSLCVSRCDKLLSRRRPLEMFALALTVYAREPASMNQSLHFEKGAAVFRGVERSRRLAS